MYIYFAVALQLNACHSVLILEVFLDHIYSFRSFFLSSTGSFPLSEQPRHLPNVEKTKGN